MGHAATKKHITTPERVAGRYQVEGVLGQGGMATVYAALDITTQRKVALKQLLPKDTPEKQEQVSRLFEHEFYTLAQLAHPRVVEAYDFGKDDAGAYYTMELLDGGDLRDLSPVPWKQACSLLADVCSALSLLHSRRLVHRDLSPRNVRCTRDLKAKLIDFGAMVPMGPCKHAIGTPAFVSPEVVALQALDARADVFSLGATLYYALTGRSAYPARSFADLRDAWRSKPRPPSAIVEDIPKELDSLVLSLIDLDPVARPVNAAEVTERLSAIAGFRHDEQLLVSKAYLSTPVLVGRKQHIAAVRRRVLGAPRKLGAALWIEGPAGVGRTRFLDACVLEAKLAGATVLKADASDAHAGKWGTARVLATRLLDELPELALRAAESRLPVLGHLLPELVDTGAGSDAVSPVRLSIPSPDVASDAEAERVVQRLSSLSQRPSSGPLIDEVRLFRSWRPPRQAPQASANLEFIADPQELRPRLQAALRDWILEISEQRFVMIAVDDIHRIDEPSAALIARLSDEVPTRALLVAVTAQADAPATAPGAIKILKESATRIGLTDLALDDTEQLLGSVFGETPNVRLLADRLQAISQGNPGAIMQLAEHLVDNGVVHYEAGAWTLPTSIDAGDLPDSLTATLKAKAKELNPDALTLAQALALSPEQGFSFDECVLLAEAKDKARALQNLNELAASGIVSTDGQFYSLGQQGWISPLIEGLGEARGRALHMKMADVFSQRGSNDFRVAMHLFAAGENQQGLDVLVHDAETSQKHLVHNTEAFYKYIHSLPRDWLDTYKYALGLCHELRRPRKQAFLLRVSLLRFSILSGLEDISILHAVTDQLFQDSGLGFYKDLGDSMDPEKRLWRALELAQQHYDSLPESDRVLSPAEAIPELARAISYVMGTASNAYDYSVVAAMPSLEPLVPLSPALEVANKVLNAGRHLLSGRHLHARQEMQGILERIARPDRAGLEDMLHRIIHFSWAFALGLIEASYGLKSSLAWADEVEQDLLHHVNAWRIRTVYFLRQGDSDKAEECKRRVEVLRIQNSPAQHFENTNLLPELLAYTQADDLVRVKRVIEDIEPAAERFRTWRPILHFARGEYQRIRGDYRGALTEVKQGLSLAAPGRHVIWQHLIVSQLKVLCGLERYSEGKKVAEQSCAAAETENLHNEAVHFRMPLALIDASLGEYENAVKNADAAVAHLRDLRATGLNLGNAYEVRAHVAILMNDHEAFSTYAELCAEQFRAGHNPALTAKYEKLMQLARRLRLGVSDTLAHAADLPAYDTQNMSSLVGSMLINCEGRGDRLRRALEILVAQANCSGGFLFTMQADGPRLCCQVGDCSPPEKMDRLVRQYVRREMGGIRDMTATVADFVASCVSEFDWTNPEGEEYRPVLLGHDAECGFYITGAALLLPDRDREFAPPVDAAAGVSKALLEAGEVSAVFAAD